MVTGERMRMTVELVFQTCHKEKRLRWPDTPLISGYVQAERPFHRAALRQGTPPTESDVTAMFSPSILAFITVFHSAF